MSRTLNDDFEDDGLPAGGLDLEQGSAGASRGSASSPDYGSDGLDFDDDPYGDANAGPLELDMPSRPHAAPPGPLPPPPGPAPPGPAPQGSSPDVTAPSSSRQGVAAPPPGPTMARESGDHGLASQAMAAADAAVRATPGGPVAPPRVSAGAVIAKYPPVPEKVLQTPMYALRVAWRQLELRADLESLRKRRSPDVPLYEEALRAYDARMFRLGMAINCAALAIATFIFFLPVILRFMRAE